MLQQLIDEEFGLASFTVFQNIEKKPLQMFYDLGNAFKMLSGP